MVSTTAADQLTDESGPGGRDAALAAAVRPLLEASGARLSVSLRLLGRGGGSATFAHDQYDTASIVKVNILAALLLRVQDEGRELTEDEREAAHEMITVSANDPATDLWKRIGRGEGLTAANRRLGLSATDPDPEGHWGLTQTTSADQVALLASVYGEDSPLTPEHRGYLDSLLRQVVPEQIWGVSAPATGGIALKNGWLPRSHTGLWDINSIGRIAVGERSCLIAVVSDRHATFEEGVAVVEAAATAAVGVLGAG